MIHAMHLQLAPPIDTRQSLSSPAGSSFEDLFSDVSKTPAAQPSTEPASTPDTLGTPGVQAWLTSYYTEMAATNPMISPLEANVPYQPSSGAATNYPEGSVYGPDQVFTQAIYNQNGYSFAGLTGQNPSNFMSQLPGVPSQAAQKDFDRDLAFLNAQRLASGQPIDTAAYWSDPGPLNYDGHVYTSQELGYAGPGQSSGPEPIFISQGNQVVGTNSYLVPGYSGTVTGIQPNRYYTLQQLEQAGLKTGQPDAQYHPGSWSAPAGS